MLIASDEYQTPKKYIKAAIEVMGSIDLDPACSYINAQRLINITNRNTPNLINATISNPQKNLFEFYSEGGLVKDWYGNVWLNPPYSKPNLILWTTKLLSEFNLNNINQITSLVPSYTAENWYQKLLNNCSAFCLPNHRINHLINGKFQTSPRFSSTFFYLGYSYLEFIDIFSQFGKCFKN